MGSPDYRNGTAGRLRRARRERHLGDTAEPVAGSGTLRGACSAVTTFYMAGGISSQTCRSDGVVPTPPPVPGAVSMQMTGWTVDGAAVLRLVSG